jgi:hypothetical protein
LIVTVFELALLRWAVPVAGTMSAQASAITASGVSRFIGNLP